MARSDPSSTQQLPLTDIHDILTVPRRRRLIRGLAGRDEWIDVEDLAEEIVDPDGVPGGDTTAADVLEALEWTTFRCYMESVSFTTTVAARLCIQARISTMSLQLMYLLERFSSRSDNWLDWLC